MLKKFIQALRTVVTKRDDLMDLADAVFEVENKK